MKIILYILSFTCIVPAFIGVRYYTSLTKDLKIMTVYTLLCVLSEIPDNYLHAHNINNLFLMHSFTVIEFVLLAWAYSFHISQVISGKAMLVIAVAFVIFSIFNTLLIQPYYTFNSYARCTEILLVLFMAVCYVYTLIINDEQRLLRMIPMFWINTAVLICFTASFFSLSVE